MESHDAPLTQWSIPSRITGGVAAPEAGAGSGGEKTQVTLRPLPGK
jgi:hypothetical protein